MKIRSRDQLSGSDRDVDWGNGRSVRMLVQSDGSPFTVTYTTVEPGSESHLRYDRHLEACYCISGRGEVVVDGGTAHDLRPGVLYCPDRGEGHRLCAESELELVCFFSPALHGSESHADGGQWHSSY